MSEQVQTTSSTPVSTHESSTPVATTTVSTTKAPKDKICPFCQTPYTASSLGRHLDAYIRPKNPKPVDGLHDVDKIREMRQSITRRQMLKKVNTKRASSTSQSRKVSGASSKQPSTGDGDEDMDDDSPTSPLTSAPPKNPNMTENGEQMRWKINELSWHDTGVMKNIPPRSLSIGSEAQRDTSRQRNLKSGLESRRRVSDELDTAKAAEMALKEVLGKVKEASARSVQAGIFDFDPYELNFPALCLKILPSPPTLRSQTPFPTNESWSLSPPGQRQWESLQRAVKEKLVGYQRAFNGISGSSPLLTPPPVDMDLNRLKHHLHEAYSNWQRLPDAQKQETWQLEILRSYSLAEENRKDLQDRLDVTIKENEELRRQLEVMRQALEDDGVERGREISRIPSVPSISPQTVQEIWKLGFDTRQWDYESLIEKWKAAMREQNQGANGMAAQRKLSAAPALTVNSRAEKPKARQSNARDKAIQSAAGLNSRSASRSRYQRTSDQGIVNTDMTGHQHEQSNDPDADAEAEMDHPSQLQPVHVHHGLPQARSPRPPTPQMNTHLSAHPYHDQRRSSAQLSPHSMPGQQRRHSTQFQLSPQPPQGQQQSHPDTLSRAPQQMMQFSQAPPLLQIPQNSEAQNMPVQSYTTQSLQQPTMQSWMPQHPQHPQAHQQAPNPVQALTPVSVSMPDQPQFNQPTIADPQFQHLGLQVPSNDGRRNSHPMIDPGHHIDMQGVEAPSSAGPFMNHRMALGIDGMPMGYVGTNMGIVGGGGGRVG
ncbi:hypothetical protein NA57DRAFT_76552 [Rhizodiscina lignyota]|uniref:Uncharacterized protein n=1 Tax=Rhizodiscina lignyota TaxID=1504668 RepID=A0A9P4ID01_9PEZI|nr:hypothetical protein NA57DRAFT_76552 [Rhizodiscina lignyota]